MIFDRFTSWVLALALAFAAISALESSGGETVVRLFKGPSVSVDTESV